jgi:HEAT repeat protein
MKLAACLLLLFSPAWAATDVDAAWSLLAGALADQNAAHRAQGLTALGNLPNNSRASQMAESALTDKEWSVRRAAAAALGEMDARSSIPKLQQALEDDTPDVVFAAARSLWVMGDRSARDVFLQILARERSDSPGVVKGAMRDAKSKAHNPAALAWMGLKQGAGMALGPFAMGVDVIEELVKDNSAAARALAASLLAEDSDPGSLSRLEDALEDKNWAVRVAAARAVGRRGSKSSLPKLQQRLQDDKEAVRCMAAASIVRLSLLPAPKPPVLRPRPKGQPKAPARTPAAPAQPSVK